MLVDTHCHLDFPEFEADLDEVIKRANEEGIGRFINIGSSLKGSEKSLELSRKYNSIYATAGIHPHEADTFDDNAGVSIRKLAGEEKVVAIGEIGLDYYKNYSKADGSTSLTIGPEWNRRTENQKVLFGYLAGLAKELNKPLVIHSRQAEEDTLNILRNLMPVKAVVHCFSGNADFLKECLGLGFFISFTCNITYKKAQSLREVVRLTPLEKLMLETDAPFLPPEGLRGRRNEPAYVRLLAEEVGRIKEVSVEDVARITTDNAVRLFNLK